ncbi:hypothetical protein B0H10DRAFT_728710 [Mycena sp. CBHHK59/15]|nr:hypothetical protein B0H10DRAFT_728710 [Mycena sp. CBHHK59/15]
MKPAPRIPPAMSCTRPARRSDATARQRLLALHHEQRLPRECSPPPRLQSPEQASGMCSACRRNLGACTAPSFSPSLTLSYGEVCRTCEAPGARPGSTQRLREAEPECARRRGPKPTLPRACDDADASTGRHGPDCPSARCEGEPQRPSRLCSGVGSAARTGAGRQAWRACWPRPDVSSTHGHGRSQASRERVGCASPREMTWRIHPKRAKSAVRMGRRARIPAALAGPRSNATAWLPRPLCCGCRRGGCVSAQSQERERPNARVHGWSSSPRRSWERESAPGVESAALTRAW